MQYNWIRIQPDHQQTGRINFIDFGWKAKQSEQVLIGSVFAVEQD
jgi:hypothetical protein